MSWHIVQQHLAHCNGAAVFCRLHCNGKAQHVGEGIGRVDQITGCIQIGDGQVFFRLLIVQCAIVRQSQRQAVFNRVLQLRSNGVVFARKNSSAAVDGVSDGIGQLKLAGTGHIHRVQVPIGNVVFRAVVGLGQCPDALTDGNRVLRPEVISYIRPVRHRCRAICRYSGLVGNGKAEGGPCVFVQR